MSTSARGSTVGQFLRGLGPVDASVAPLHLRSPEDFAGFPDVVLDAHHGTYRTYGYIESTFVAQKFLADYCSAFDAAPLAAQFRGRLFNSGMAATASIFRALDLRAGDTVIRLEKVYAGSRELIDRLVRAGVRVLVARSTEQLDQAVDRAAGGRTVVFLERVGNHHEAEIVALATISRLAANESVTVVLDISMVGGVACDPSVFAHVADRIALVGSLSKFHRVDDVSRVSAGVALVPVVMADALHAAASDLGSYLQFLALQEMPLALWEVGANNAVSAMALSRRLSAHVTDVAASSQSGVDVLPPMFESPDDARCLWPPYFFLRFLKAGGSTPAERVHSFIARIGLPLRGGFGHATTSLLPLGLRWPTVDDGIVRVSVGTRDDGDALAERFSLYFANPYEASGGPPFGAIEVLNSAVRKRPPR